MARRPRFLLPDALGAASVAGIAVAVTMHTIDRVGHLSYPLDDPYIHLRLSEMIHGGHYGLNAGAASSPSSSILWPFLLAPFATAGWHLAVPLILNIAALAACVPVAAALLRRAWPERATVWATPAAVALVLAANTLATALVGMEHGAQTLIALVLGLAILRAADGDDLPWWCWAAAIVAPLVRYEAALVSGAFIAVAWATGHRRGAVRCGAAVAAALGGFSLFLVVQGLDPLPSSILAKANGGLANLARHGGLVPVVATALLATAVAAAVRRDRRAGLVAGAVAAVMAGHLVAGSTDDLRYATSVTALSLAAIAAVAPRLAPAPGPRRFGAIVLLGALFAMCGVRAAQIASQHTTASIQIAQQQCQLHELVVQHLRQEVAANDIGCISYRSPYPVLDLWGLASQEARHAREAERPGWVGDLVRERDVDVAVIYTEWFGPYVPRDWVRVGKVLATVPGYSSRIDVDVYATRAGAVDEVRRALTAFAADDHPGTVVQLRDATD